MSRLIPLFLGSGLVRSGLVFGAGPSDAGLLLPQRNLLLYSEDLTSVWVGGANRTTTTMTPYQQYGSTEQRIDTLDGVTYTLSFKARDISGNTSLEFVHYDSASGHYTPVTITGTLAEYSLSVLGRSGGGTVAFGLADPNASGWGETELTEIQVSESASLLDYQLTTDLQTITDWSGQGNDAQRGSTSGSDTNDPTRHGEYHTFDGVDDYWANIPAKAATWTIVNASDTACDSVDSAGGKYRAGVANGSAVEFDVGNAGNYTGNLAVRLQYTRVLTAPQQKRNYNAILKAGLTA